MSSTGHGIILHRHPLIGQTLGQSEFSFQIHGLASPDLRTSVHLRESTSCNWCAHPRPRSSCERRFLIYTDRAANASHRDARSTQLGRGAGCPAPPPECTPRLCPECLEFTGPDDGILLLDGCGYKLEAIPPHYRLHVVGIRPE